MRRTTTLAPGRVRGARRLGVLAAIAISVAGLAGCGAPPAENTPLAGNFVGEVEGTNALISVVVGKDFAVAYVCDSEEIAEGFGGRIDGSTLALDGLDGTGRAEVKVGRAAASGTVTIGGVAHRFTARTAPATAGYFSAHGTIDGRAVTAQWVVGADGKYRGAVIDRTTSGLISLSPTGVHVEFDIRFDSVIIGDRRVPLTHITPIHIEHSVQFPMPVDILRPGLAY